MPSTMSLPVESLFEGAELPSRRIVLQPWREMGDERQAVADGKAKSCVWTAVLWKRG